MRRMLAFGVSMMLCLSASVRAQEEPSVAKGNRTRGLVGGWGHSWRPIFGQTTSEITFGAFHPRMGWFVTDRLELYGEATLFVYDRPHTAVAAGLVGLSGRYYLKTHGAWLPYGHAGSGLLLTSLHVPVVDRIFNFQLLNGVRWRLNRV